MLSADINDLVIGNHGLIGTVEKSVNCHRAGWSTNQLNNLCRVHALFNFFQQFRIMLCIQRHGANAKKKSGHGNLYPKISDFTLSHFHKAIISWLKSLF